MASEIFVENDVNIIYFRDHKAELYEKYWNKWLLIDEGRIKLVADSQDELNKKALELNISGGLRTLIHHKRPRQEMKVYSSIR